METLLVTVEISPKIPQAAETRRQLQIYLTQYAAELCSDLGLPIEPKVAAVVAQETAGLPPGEFRLLINNQVCRTRLWPYIPISELPAKEIGVVLSEALHYNRASLLTASLAESIAEQWGIRKKSEYLNGWSAEGFKEFLIQFVRRDFSIERAHVFMESGRPGAATKSEAQLCFEEALEQAKGIQFGVALSVGAVETAEPDQELAKALAARIGWVAADPGLALPDVKVQRDAVLPVEDFTIRLNDVRLPAFRGLPKDSTIVVNPKQDLSKPGIESCTIVDPIAGMSYQVVKDTPEVRAKCVAANLTLWNVNTYSYVGACLGSALSLHAGSFLAAPVLQFLVDRLSDSRALIQQVQSRLEALAVNENDRVATLRWVLTAILRNLLDEQVPIRDLRAVLESLLFMRELRGAGDRVIYSRTPADSLILAEGKTLRELTVDDLSACARVAIRSLALRYSTPVEGGSALRPLLLAVEIEQRLLAAGTDRLTDHDVGRLRRAVFHHLSSLRLAADPAILVSQPIRRHVRELLSMEFPSLGILGLYELPPNLRALEPAGIINWPADPLPQEVAAKSSGAP
ncbi:MAG: FHIPEP family type III secretion protein [Bryobacteraceae bacterium]